MAVHLNDKVGETAPQAQIPTPKSASRRKRQSFISPEPKIKAEQIAVGRSRRGRLVVINESYPDFNDFSARVLIFDALFVRQIDEASELVGS